MAKLKGVVFGIRDVLTQSGKIDDAMFQKIGRLVQYLDAQGIECVAVSNQSWIYTSGGDKEPLQVLLKKAWGVSVRCYCYGNEGFPAKQSAAALEYIRKQKNWEANEMLYVGNSKDDMLSALNGKVLFINALWFGDNCEYGIRIKSPKKVARFVDVFCLREHWWYFAIEESGLRVYALAPFSTYADPRFKAHSEDFIQTVKRELGDAKSVNFWAWYLCTSLYFSGVYEEVNFIVPYPCHTAGDYPTVLEKPLSVFAKCFRGNYLQDLIVRHTTALESKKNRNIVSHEHQLNTVRLNAKPLKSPTERYKNPPLKNTKTVLVVDDIVTEGYSLEAARTLIERTRAKVISVALLKTLSKAYRKVEDVDFSEYELQYYETFKFEPLDTAETFGYHDHIVDRDAAADLSERLQRYKDWDWPEEE